MTKLYYKNSQTNDFKQLTYKDIGAASLTHTHTMKDIQATDMNGKSILQQLSMSNGGANIVNQSKNSAGIYAAKENLSHIQAIPINNGVFGYYNGSNYYPNFQLWPTTAGGTGCTNALDTAKKFGIYKTNTQTTYTLDLNYRHIMDAYFTNTMKKIVFSIYLPFQLLSKTVVYISLYPWLVQQNSVNTNTYANSKWLCGFSDIAFTVGEYKEILDCIFYYGHGGDGNTEAGRALPDEPQGNIIIRSYGGEPVFNNNNQLLYYQAGHIISIEMIFKEAIPIATSSSEFQNNRPLQLIFNKGLKTLKNQLVIPSIYDIIPSQSEDTDEDIEEEEENE